MSKKILILSTSPRKGGNSDGLADAFAEGAREAGHQVEKIVLYDKTIGFCRGCLACQKTQRCATPIYFYEMCGQMKTLLDRTNPLFPSDYAFRDIYLLASAADGAESAMDGAAKGLQGWIDCFEKSRLKGVVRGVGVTGVGEIQNVPAALKAAYDLGRQA